MPTPVQTDPITEILQRAKTIAVVGLSANPLRPSHGVAAYLQAQGYHIIPVNPQIEAALGEKAYPSLLDVPEKVDIVNIFRRPEFVSAIVKTAIRRHRADLPRWRTPAHLRAGSLSKPHAAEGARPGGPPRIPRCLDSWPR